MRPLELFQRYMIRRLEARRRGASVRRMVDFAIGVCALGSIAMIGAAFALRAPGLGIELGSRLVFVLCLLLAARPWLPGQGGPEFFGTPARRTLAGAPEEAPPGKQL